jgi:hypothetical protein
MHHMIQSLDPCGVADGLHLPARCDTCVFPFLKYNWPLQSPFAKSITIAAAEYHLKRQYDARAKINRRQLSRKFACRRFDATRVKKNYFDTKRARERLKESRLIEFVCYHAFIIIIIIIIIILPS